MDKEIKKMSLRERWEKDIVDLVPTGEVVEITEEDKKLADEMVEHATKMFDEAAKKKQSE